MQCAAATRHRTAFTLIEMAAVLILIALIAGAIVVGAHLVQIAEIRQTIAQYKSFTAAVYTFRNRYAGLPADLRFDQAEALGFPTGDGTFGSGNGDGLISNACPEDDAYRFRVLGREGYGFWIHLSQAGLIGYRPRITGWFTLCNVTSYYSPPSRVLPPAALGAQFNWAVYEDGVNNHFLLSSFDLFSPSFPLRHLIPPATARVIDTKIDDGAPMTGIVAAVTIPAVSHDLRTPPVPLPPAAGVCVTTETGTPYNTSSSTYQSTPSCSLRFRME